MKRYTTYIEKYAKEKEKKNLEKKSGRILKELYIVVMDRRLAERIGVQLPSDFVIDPILTEYENLNRLKEFARFENGSLENYIKIVKKQEVENETKRIK